MDNYQVIVNFQEIQTGGTDYNLPHVFSIRDPKEGIKATVIEGTRGDGAIIIPGGKRSQEIVVRGNIFGTDYEDLTAKMNEMRSQVTTEVATLTLSHLAGETPGIDWSYIVRRITEINFSESLRLDSQEYEITFKIISY